MTFLSQNELQTSFYAQLAHNSLKLGSMSDTNIIFRSIKSIHDSSTQIVNELGTTDVAIGDATAEIMITTLGKIPNEMYYLEDTTFKTATYGTELHTILDSNHTTLTPIEIVKSEEYTERSTLLLILLTVLLIILFMCCITACIIARSRSRHTFFTKSDIECDPGCSGVKQPLLGLDRINKNSDTTRTSDNSSIQN